MSTRAQIVIKERGKDVHFIYQHGDGYVDMLGKDLRADLVKFSKTAKRFDAEEFFSFMDSKGYECEDWGVHGDEEYIYEVDFTDSGSAKVSAKSYDYETKQWSEVDDYSFVVHGSQTVQVTQQDKSCQTDHQEQEDGTIRDFPVFKKDLNTMLALCRYMGTRPNDVKVGAEWTLNFLTEDIILRVLRLQRKVLREENGLSDNLVAQSKAIKKLW